MKRTILFFSILLVAATMQAQDIFKKHGYDRETLTLSKGRYKETFINENVMQIGTVLIDTRTDKVVQFLEEDATEVVYRAESTSRFLTPDPLAEKYPQLSPYVYCSNNPINAIDPNGKDVVILNAPQGAGGRGHMASILQDKQGNWYYMTMGAADPNGTVSKMLSEGVQGGMAIVNLGTTDKTEALNLAKQDKNNSEYTQELHLTTSSNMDERIHQSALDKQSSVNSGNEKYNAISNNCADAVIQVVGKGTGTDLPSKTNPSPNSYFKKLEENQREIQININFNINIEKLQEKLINKWRAEEQK